MRLYTKRETILSEDTATVPVEIRFKSADEVTDLTLIKDGGGTTKTYAIGTHPISLTQITEGRWLYIKSDKAIVVKINSTNQFEIFPNKPFEGWLKFTQLDLVTTEISRITLAVAGE